MSAGLGKMTPLRRLCWEHGLSRAGAAKRAGLSHQTVYNIEAGLPAAPATLAKLGEVFGMTVPELAARLGFVTDAPTDEPVAA